MKAKDVIISYSRNSKFLDMMFQISLQRLSEICLGYDNSLESRFFMVRLLPCQLVLSQCDYLDTLNDSESASDKIGCSIVEKDGYEIHYCSYRSYKIILYIFDKITGKVVNFKNNNSYKEYETLKLFIEACIQK
jgi:hypothetical protein